MKKILIALLVLGQFAVADSVSNWCGYNGELVQKLNDDAYFKKNIGWDKKGMPVIAVSSFSKKELEQIALLYKAYNFNHLKILKAVDRDLKKKSGIWYEIINKIVLQKLDSEETYIVFGYILGEGLYEYAKENSDLPNPFFINKKEKYIIFINSKFMKANFDFVKKNVKYFSDYNTVKMAFPNGFNPCE